MVSAMLITVSNAVSTIISKYFGGRVKCSRISSPQNRIGSRRSPTRKLKSTTTGMGRSNRNTALETLSIITTPRKWALL